MDTDGRQRNGEKGSFKEADDDLAELNGGFGGQHDGCRFREENDLNHRHDADESTGLQAERGDLALDDEDGQEHFSQTDGHGSGDFGGVGDSAQLQQRLEKLKALERELKEKEKAVRAKEKSLKEKDKAKKQMVLRLSPTLWNEIAAWAEEDFRSINGQVEYLLSECVRKRKGG